MSANENIQTVKTLYDAFGKGDIGTILDNLADDVDWAAEAAGDVAPWWGNRSGKEEVGKFFEDFGGAAEVEEFTPVSYAGNDEDEVMAVIRYRAEMRSTGKEVAMDLHHFWRFRDGKVAYYRGTEDSHQTMEALEG
jgi:ketosteroid isomerase-like protein